VVWCGVVVVVRWGLWCGGVLWMPMIVFRLLWKGTHVTD
jgi:hypothetical protein